MKNKLEVHGLKELKNGLSKRVDKTKIKDVIKLNIAELQKKAMKTVPKDTRTLERSIMIEIVDGGMVGIIGATAHYGGYVEWGTRFMNAQPYIRPNLDIQGKIFINDLKRIMR